VHPKCADSMAVSGLHFGNTLVGSEWTTAVLLCTNALRKTVLSPCMLPISCGEAFIQVWVSGCQLSAVTIASKLMGWCGLSHELVYRGWATGCKSTCRKFEG